MLINKTLYFARRPKGDNFDPPPPFSGDEDELEDGLDEEELDEEVDFDNPSFKREQIWADYAEDLDYDQ